MEQLTGFGVSTLIHISLKIFNMILKYEEYKLNNFTAFERAIFQPPFKPSVRYDNEACFVYSISGNAISYGGIEKEYIKSKESILMKCGSFVNNWVSSDGDEPCRIITIHISPEILNVIYEDKIPDFLSVSSKKSNKLLQKITQQKIIDEYIKGLLFYFENPFLIDNHLISLKLKEFILLLYNINQKELRDLLSSLFHPADHSFKSIVQTHLYENLEIKDFAALTNTSLSTFKRKFKQLFNETPARYLNDKRLLKAAQLLKLTEKRITDICYECGFNDPSTFSRIFSKKFNASPRSFRSIEKLD